MTKFKLTALAAALILSGCGGGGGDLGPTQGAQSSPASTSSQPQPTSSTAQSSITGPATDSSPSSSSSASPSPSPASGNPPSATPNVSEAPANTSTATPIAAGKTTAELLSYISQTRVSLKLQPVPAILQYHPNMGQLTVDFYADGRSTLIHAADDNGWSRARAIEYRIGTSGAYLTWWSDTILHMPMPVDRSEMIFTSAYGPTLNPNVYDYARAGFETRYDGRELFCIANPQADKLCVDPNNTGYWWFQLAMYHDAPFEYETR